MFCGFKLRNIKTALIGMGVDMVMSDCPQASLGKLWLKHWNIIPVWDALLHLSMNEIVETCPRHFVNKGPTPLMRLCKRMQILFWSLVQYKSNFVRMTAAIAETLRVGAAFQLKYRVDKDTKIYENLDNVLLSRMLVANIISLFWYGHNCLVTIGYFPLAKYAPHKIARLLNL